MIAQFKISINELGERQGGGWEVQVVCVKTGTASLFWRPNLKEALEATVPWVINKWKETA